MKAITGFLQRHALRLLACWTDAPYAVGIVAVATGTQTIAAAPASGQLRGRFMWAVRAPANSVVHAELYVGSQQVVAAQIGSNAWFYTAQALGVAPGPLNNTAIVRNNDLTPLFDARSAALLQPGFGQGFYPQEFILNAGESARWITTTANAQLLSVRFQGTQTTP